MIEYADIVCGLAWGDEAKGKITSQLASSGDYDYVCRWAGGNNAGHTVYVDGQKYKTHLIPSGIFYGIKSVIGPGCVVNVKSFFKEIEYLNKHGFNTSLVKISPRAHVVTEEHILRDKNNQYEKLGTTAKGIGPCYADKSKRTGIRVEDFDDFKSYIWDAKLEGKVLCEGAQGFWLDLDYGNYPFVTSSTTLPYAACSLGFAPQKIRRVYGAAKIYDTRSGLDPEFPETLLDDPELTKIGMLGQEYGVTTGRRRKVNWLNLSKLVQSVNISGCTDVIISKVDILKELNYFKIYYNNQLIEFENLNQIKTYVLSTVKKNCELVERVIFSSSPKKI